MAYNYGPPTHSELADQLIGRLPRGYIWHSRDGEEWPESQWLVFDGNGSWLKLYSGEGDEIRRWIGIRDEYAKNVMNESAVNGAPN